MKNYPALSTESPLQLNGRTTDQLCPFKLAEQEAQVIDRQFAQGLCISAYCTLKDETLLLLQLQDALLDGARDYKAGNCDGLVLSEPMDAVLQRRAG